jgi:hypothetical protein
MTTRNKRYIIFNAAFLLILWAAVFQHWAPAMMLLIFLIGFFFATALLTLFEPIARAVQKVDPPCPAIFGIGFDAFITTILFLTGHPILAVLYAGHTVLMHWALTRKLPPEEGIPESFEA